MTLLRQLLLLPFPLGLVLAAPACPVDNFSNIDIPGIDILRVATEDVRDYSITTLPVGDIAAANLTSLDFCSVNVTYTHPGKDDSIILQVWLPLEDKWNGRFQGTGGGGWTTGFGSLALAPAVNNGYAAASTNGGHESMVSDDWALLEPGKVDLTLLEDFASIALNDLALIGKAVTTQYYGKAPAYSYWSGCSTGGRQGMMLAQRYPTAFDGILALAPAINWVRLIVAIYWPQQVMNMLDYYPRPCELNYLTAAAIEACDSLDGVEDGIISLPGLCDFNPKSLIGGENACEGDENIVTWQAATIAAATWHGFTNQAGERLWYGQYKDVPLTGIPDLSLADTQCSSQERSSCTGAPFGVGDEWIRLFIEKDPDFDTSNMTYAEYEDVFYRSIEEYTSIINTANPDLSAFRETGGKILTWHGMADQVLMVDGTLQYYENVLECDPGAADFYRVFLAPGTLHCMAGAGPYPYNSLDRLVAWVEESEAPDTLFAVRDGTTRPLCQYPKVQTYVGGDPDLLESFTCA